MNKSNTEQSFNANSLLFIKSKRAIKDFKQTNSKVIKENISDKILNCRFNSIEWIFKTGEVLNLKEETIFKAIQLVDEAIFANLKEEDVNEDEIKLNVIICLNLASKLDDSNSNLFNAFYKKFYSKSQIITKKQYAMKELEILKKLNFNLSKKNFYTCNQNLNSIIEGLLPSFKENNFQKEFSEIQDKIIKCFSLKKEALVYSATESALIINQMSLIFYESNISDDETSKMFLKKIKKIIKMINKKFNDFDIKNICRNLLLM